MLRSESLLADIERDNREELQEGLRKSFSHMCESIVTDRTKLPTSNSGFNVKAEAFNLNFAAAHDLRYLMSGNHDPDQITDTIHQFLTTVTQSKEYRMKAVKKYLLSGRSVKRAFMNAAMNGKKLRKSMHLWWEEEEARTKLRLRQRIQQYQSAGSFKLSSSLLSKYGGYSVSTSEKEDAIEHLYRQRLLRFREEMQTWNSTEGKEEATLMRMISETRKWMDSKVEEQTSDWVSSPSIFRRHSGYLPEVGTKPLETTSDLKLRLETLTEKLTLKREQRPVFDFSPASITLRDLVSALETVKQRQKIPHQTLETLHSACLVFKGPGALRRSPYPTDSVKRSVTYSQVLPCVGTPPPPSGAREISRKRSRGKLIANNDLILTPVVGCLGSKKKSCGVGDCISAAQLAASSKKLLRFRKSSRPPNSYNRSVRAAAKSVEEVFSARVWSAAQVASCRSNRTPSAKKRMRSNRTARSESSLRPFLFFQNHTMLVGDEFKARLELVTSELSAGEELVRKFLINCQLLKRRIISDTFCILTAFTTSRCGTLPKEDPHIEAS